MTPSRVSSSFINNAFFSYHEVDEYCGKYRSIANMNSVTQVNPRNGYAEGSDAIELQDSSRGGSGEQPQADESTPNSISETDESSQKNQRSVIRPFL